MPNLVVLALFARGEGGGLHGDDPTVYTTYGVYTILFAGKSPNIRSCTVYIYVLANPTYVI